MRKYLTRIITFTLVCTMIFCNVTMVKATESQNKGEQNFNNTLLVAGYPQEIIDQFSQKEKQDNAEIYIKSPDSVSVTTTTLEIDVLAEMDSYVNSTYDEKISMGATDENIEQMDKQIEYLEKRSDNELKEEFQIDDVTVRLMKEAIEPDDEYKIKDANNDINASGAISTSEMTFTQAVVDNSTPNTSYYNVSLYFYWNNWYFYGIFNDKLVVAWGGNLLHHPISSSISYYTQGPDGAAQFVSYDQSSNPSYVETTINSGGYYEFPQTINGSKARYGNFKFVLRQAGRELKATKVISQFAHQILTIFSADISVSGAPTISIGGSYDTSMQRSSIITY